MCFVTRALELKHIENILIYIYIVTAYCQYYYRRVHDGIGFHTTREKICQTVRSERNTSQTVFCK
jgi:hypothetical protein